MYFQCFLGFYFRNQQVMQFVQISQPVQVIATSSSDVNKVQTRSVAKIKSEPLSNIKNDSTIRFCHGEPERYKKRHKNNQKVRKRI